MEIQGGQSLAESIRAAVGPFRTMVMRQEAQLHRWECNKLYNLLIDSHDPEAGTVRPITVAERRAALPKWVLEHVDEIDGNVKATSL